MKIFINLVLVVCLDYSIDILFIIPCALQALGIHLGVCLCKLTFDLSVHSTRTVQLGFAHVFMASASPPVFDTEADGDIVLDSDWSDSRI